MNDTHLTSTTVPPSLLPWKRYDTPECPEVLEPTDRVEEAGNMASLASGAPGTCMTGLERALRCRDLALYMNRAIQYLFKQVT